MKPRLVAVAGPLQGSVFELGEEPSSIGRDLANPISIPDASVSRRHSVVTSESGAHKISDLESLNGTLVNGVPVRERILQHGDQVEIGSSLFFYLCEESPQPAPREAAATDVRLGSTSTLRLEEALYVVPGKIPKAFPGGEAAGRLARDLELLLEAGRAAASARGVESLGQDLLKLLLEVLPADRGTLLVCHGADCSATASRDRKGPCAPFSVSSTVTGRLLKENAAILSNDVLETSGLDRSESLAVSGIRALAAAPFSGRGKVSGLLYFDSEKTERSFDEGHLQLLLGFANLAGLALENAERLEWLEAERQRLGAELALETDFVGESPRMREIYELLARVAPADTNVLILGESGTGKELAARTLHSNSPRAGKAFVAINCAALTETLLESELFGHERGAFTGAIAQKKGKLEAADGGTVFLDEVAELPPAIQAKLLRVLEQREFERVGGTRPLKVDIRLIAATNKNLGELVKAGKFREDLYYRLDVVAITMPCLRDRQGDIPLLATYFAAKYGKKFNKPVSGISPAARSCLLRYDWPGNVRELSNAIERAVVLGDGDLLEPEDFPESLLERSPVGGEALTGYHAAVNEAKKQAILRAVEETRGNLTEAAKRLGLHPNYLHRLIRNLNLKDALKK